MNAYLLLSQYLTLLEVRYTFDLKKMCLKLPFMDTLYGYSILLKRYKVKNIVIDMTERKTDLKLCQFPAIVPFKDVFIIVYQVSESFVYYWEKGKRYSSSFDDFLQKWSGVILLAEKTDFSEEPDYKQHLLTIYLKRGCLLLILASICFYFYGSVAKNTPYSITVLISIVLNAAGACLSFLLYQKDFHLSNSYVEKICIFMKSGSCDAVINSTESKFLGIVSWSQIGLGYFLSNILLLLVFPQYYIFFFSLSALSLPYTFWSIWYQKVRVKRWCILCLLVQVILWMIFVNNLFLLDELSYSIDVLSWSIFTMIYCTPFYVLFLYSLSRNEANIENIIYRHLVKLKYDDMVFEYLLYRADKYLDYRDASAIFIGNKNAKIIISFITNLSCAPCAYMHNRIKLLKGQLEGDVAIQYIFYSPTKEIRNCAKKLIFLYQKGGELEFIHGLDCWLKNDRVNFDDGIDDNCNNQGCDVEDEYMKHEIFVNKYDIHRTPTILINGCVLPDLYRVEDLIYFV